MKDERLIVRCGARSCQPQNMNARAQADLLLAAGACLLNCSMLKHHHPTCTSSFPPSRSPCTSLKNRSSIINMSALNPPASPAAVVPAPEAGAAPVAPPQPQPVAAVSAPAPVAAADASVVPKQEPAAAPAPAPVAAPVPAPAPAPASTPASHRSNAMNSLPIRAYLDQTVVPILLDGEL